MPTDRLFSPKYPPGTPEPCCILPNEQLSARKIPNLATGWWSPNSPAQRQGSSFQPEASVASPPSFSNSSNFHRQVFSPSSTSFQWKDTILAWPFVLNPAFIQPLFEQQAGPMAAEPHPTLFFPFKAFRIQDYSCLFIMLGNFHYFIALNLMESLKRN